MPIKSKILFAENGIDKLKSVERSMDRYGGLSASKLVSLTHREGTPWHCSYDGTPFKVISDEIIKERHYLERVE